MDAVRFPPKPGVVRSGNHKSQSASQRDFPHRVEDPAPLVVRRRIMAKDDAAPARQVRNGCQQRLGRDTFVGEQPQPGQGAGFLCLAGFTVESGHVPLYIRAMMSTSADPHAAARLNDVNAAIDKAAGLAGRRADSIALVAISKTHDADAIRPLLDAGQRHFGENRVQEAQAKWPALKDDTPDVVLHLVGQLQSNKAADAVALFDVIHSVDRPSLVAALIKAAKEQEREPVCFIQVNIGDEPQKGGCAIDDLPELVALVRKSPELSLAGLMCVPPADVESAPYFALLAKLARENDLTGLSMGMSGDFETAVMLGATHVRVGTALFGARDYSA